MGSEVNHLRPESYPMLPDIESHTDDFSPHPDGRPWRKACGECAFRTSDPQDLGRQYQEHIRDGADGYVFYCLHREDGGFNRICACDAACREGRSLVAGRSALSTTTKGEGHE